MNKKVIAIDLDNTIYGFTPNSVYKTKEKMGVEGYSNGFAITKNIKMLKELKKKYKCKLIIYSSRWWGDYQVVKNWLDNIKFPYDDIILGRFKADLYFCDRAVNAIVYSKKQLVDKLKD